MRKRISLWAIVLLMLACAFSVTACGDNTENPPADSLNFEQVYAMAQDAGYSGTLEELIAAFKGDSAYKIAVSKGYKGSEADWLASLVGASGKDGVNGADGNDGADGLSAYALFKKYNPDYLGNEQQWVNDLAAGRLVRFTITFKAAGSPDIVKSVFHGYDLTDVPPVPEKAGNTGEWDRTSFIGITENITVTAIYKTKGINFELINGSEYKVVSANLDNNIASLKIPDEHEGKPVTTIGFQAFMNYTSLTHVTIPNSVTRIEASAFSGCTGLQDMTIPFAGESLNGESNTQFGYIFGVANNKLPESLKTVAITGSAKISAKAFQDCRNITSVTIGNSVTSIGDYAFSSCWNLNQIVFGNGVTSIGDSAFYFCFGLTSITIGNGVTSIGNRAFDNCDNLTSVIISNSVTSIGNEVFNGCTKLSSITIPDSVTSIGLKVFEDCTSLKYDIYSGNLRYINNVLIGVTSTSITATTLKPTTTIIASCAFSDCTSLISLIIPDSVISIDDSAFYSCKGLSQVTIGNSVTSIGSHAFRRCSNLSQVKIPDSVTHIGEGTFDGCTNLNQVIFGNSVTSIGTLAFYECISLSQVKIPDSVISIGDNVFQACTNLSEITIGRGVKSIGSYAFDGCSGLIKVYYGGADAVAWGKITISSGNDALKNATRYYYSEAAIYDNAHWRYENGVPTVWTAT